MTMIITKKNGTLSKPLYDALKAEPDLEITELPEPGSLRGLADKYEGRLSKESAEAILKDIEESKGDYSW